ncbi:hypothetical protein Tco_0339537 [Tanacetum coccineum]
MALKRQEKEANDAAEAFRKEFAQCENLLLQAGAARATSTNTVNTVSTPVSTVSPSIVFSAGYTTIHPSTQILGDPTLAVQTMSKVNRSSRAHAFVSYIQKQRKTIITRISSTACLLAPFLDLNSQKISQALEDES